MTPKLALIESNPGEYLHGRAATVMGRALRGVGLEPDFVTEAEADVLVYLFNWEDGDWLLKHHLNRSLPLKKARGYVFDNMFGTAEVIIPTYHPRLVGAGSMHFLPLLVWDLRLAASLPVVPSFPTEDLILTPSPRELGEFLAVPSEWLVIDLETVGSMGDEEDLDEPSMQIVRASLARNDCKAITFPWQEPFISSLLEHLAYRKPELVGWNCNDFDWPRLREFGWSGLLERCKLTDCMWLFKYMNPRLPRGLGAVSTLYDRVPEWKSLSNSEEELYSAMDARQTAKIYLGIRRVLGGRQV